jgi:hypothetical protein
VEKREGISVSVMQGRGVTDASLTLASAAALMAEAALAAAAPLALASAAALMAEAALAATASAAAIAARYQMSVGERF